MIPLTSRGSNDQGNHYANHPLKRISLADLLRFKVSSMVTNKSSDKLLRLKESDILDQETLPFSSSCEGVWLNFVNGLSVSSCGDKVWACRIQKKVDNRYISRLMVQDFQKDSRMYDYEHQNLILCVSVSEAFDVCLSGGYDQTLAVHDLESRKLLFTLDMNHQVSCLLDLGSAVAVGDGHTVRFLDLDIKQIGREPGVKTLGDSIACMDLSLGKTTQNGQMYVLVGGSNSSQIDKVAVPKEFARLGKQILKIRNRHKISEKFCKKIVDLQNQNRSLLN
ncbi:MAG: hypothetical protein AAFO91_04880 [Bacteroidota bacterium]